MVMTDTAIIGAGPYGLSLAAHLSSRKIAHEIIGKPMEAWRSYMPPGMLMRSEAFASSLWAPDKGFLIEDYFRSHGLPYQSVGMRLPLEAFAAYGMWFQSNLVPGVKQTEVKHLERRNNVFELQTADGCSVTAKRAVIALGLKSFEKIPLNLRGFSRDLVVHSAELGPLDWGRGKDVTIIGGGQSALGLAALLQEGGARVSVIVRDAHVSWNSRPDPSRSFLSRVLKPEGGLGPGWRSHIFSELPQLFYNLDYARRKRIIESSWGPSGAWWLEDRVVGKVDLHLSSHVASLVPRGKQLSLTISTDGAMTTRLTDRVIVATGFKIDVQQHAFLSTEIKNSIEHIDGAPKLSRHFETSIPGLYIIGPASAYSFGPVMRFVYGAKYAARTLTRRFRKVTR